MEVDESANETGFFKATAFAETYQQILARPEIRSSRVTVFEKKDMKELVYKEKRFNLEFKKDDGTA